MKTAEIMTYLKDLDLHFKVKGPFMVADLSEANLKDIPFGPFGEEKVKDKQRTKSHTHKFPSFYKSSGLDVECENERVVLPKEALTLVLPGINHSWVPKFEEGYVASVDSRHQKQILAFAI